MRHLKARLLAVVIIMVFAALTYYNWHQLGEEGLRCLDLL
jgi:hypothetical protein